MARSILVRIRVRILRLWRRLSPSAVLLLVIGLPAYGMAISSPEDRKVCAVHFAGAQAAMVPDEPQRITTPLGRMSVVELSLARRQAIGGR
ncbi:MAG: hypothetical protein K2P80_01030 [Beijerinckiaceae bacterium]|nr:hypothetical protein [Beijerinckiaceae bacterium]